MRYNKLFQRNALVLKVYLFLLKTFKRFYYKDEINLLEGRSKSISNRKSILYFTTYKCASTFLHKKLEELAAVHDLKTINFDSLLSYEQKQVFYDDVKKMESIFLPNGFYYGPYRKFRNVPNLDNYKIVLVLRDPRDVITSHYFSTAFNHPVVDKKFLEFRDKAKKMTIDEYVIDRIPEFKTYYTQYVELMNLNLREFLFLKYEDMIEDFDGWFRKLTDFVDLTQNESQIEEIIATSNFTVKQENPNAFIRNIKAGDHLRKLMPETIEVLNTEFFDILTKLSYR